MDQERSDVDKLDEVMLPGFRFHPTDEELVGFYLKKKIQQRPLSVELIRQLDIYKHDPWDLPKLAATGEKEWYFYCPRDRKYRNSARPNRVTGAGFWKATGTDRPIYSSDGTTKCIGLKKSLVFYKGRAAKGIKTDWMMHEFRLPSLTDHSGPPKRYMDKTIPANDSWAICRIFKKTNSTAQRALSHSWVTPLTETFTPKTLIEGAQSSTRFSPDHNISIASNTSPAMQFSCYTNDFQQSSVTNFSSLDHHVPYFKPSNPTGGKPSQLHLSPADQLASNFMFSTTETSGGSPAKSMVDVSSMLLNMSSYSMFGDFGKASESVDFGESGQEHCNGFSITLPQEIQVANLISKEHDETTAASLKTNDQNVTRIDYDDQYWGGAVRSLGLSPLGLPLNMSSIDAWKSNFLWDSSPCPTEMSTTNYSSY